jgi:Protein of unknown function (DUF1302)
MRRSYRLPAWAILILSAPLITALAARADDSITVFGDNVSMQNVAETDWAISTAAKGNSFNSNFQNCAGHAQRGCGLATSSNSWNLMAYRLDTMIGLRLDPTQADALGLDSVEAFVHGRFWSDIAPYADGALPAINAEGFRQRYAGNGWAAQIAEHEYEIDAAEAYVDLHKGPVWLRLGKQQIVFGEELGIQTLDQVDSLDFRRHSLFNFSGLEFSDARIAEWTARATYDASNLLEPLHQDNAQFSAWISPDFQPDVYLPGGSPYHTSPAYSIIENLNGISRARHKLVYGAVLESKMFDVDWSVNFYSTPEHVGWFKYIGAPMIGGAPNPAVFPVDNFRGAQLFGPGGGFHDALITREMPRIFIYGGMLGYTIEPIYQFPGAILLNGDQIRVSATYTPDKDFTGPNTLNPLSPSVNRPLRVGEMNMALDVERDVRWFEGLPSTYLFLEYNFRSRSDLFDDYLAQPAYGNHHDFNLAVIGITQPLGSNRWQLIWVQSVEGNAGGSIFEQPAVVYKPSSHQEYRVFWNFATGTNESYLGPSRYMDEIVFAAIYKF